MATPKKRNPQDATVGRVKRSDDALRAKNKALRQDVNEAIGAIQALEIRVQAIEKTMRGEAPYVDPAQPPPLTNGE